MSQDSDSSASGDENQDLLEPAAEETEAVSTAGLADVSASTSMSNLNTSFVGKVRTKVSNILSTIFSRSPPAATTSIHKQPRQLTNTESFRPIEQRKRKHSPAASPSLIIDDRYEEMVRKRSRLNAPTATVATQTAATGPSNRNVRSATPSRLQQRTSRREIQRRLASRKVAGRGLTPTIQHQLARSTVAEPVQDSQESVGVVARTSPAFVPSESTPVSSIERDSRAESVASTAQSTNSQSQLKDEGDSVTTGGSTRKQQQQKVPWGIRQIYEATAKVNDDPSRRYSTFLGNRIYNQRQQAKHRSLGGDSLNFSSHLDRRKSLFAATTFERPAFNPSVYSSMSSLRNDATTRSPLASPFYDGVTRYGGASAAPLNYARQLERRAQLLSKPPAPTTERKETPSDTQWIQNILKAYSKPLDESQKREAQKYLLENKELREQLRNPYLPIGTPIRMQKPWTTREDMERQKQAQLIPTKELVVPRVLEMMTLKQHLKETAVIDPPTTITHQPIQFMPLAQQQHPPNETVQSLDSKQTTKMKPKLNRARGELSAKDREMYTPAVPLELPNVKLPEMAAFPKFDLNLPYTSSSSSAARSIVRHEPPTQSSETAPVQPLPPPVTTLQGYPLRPQRNDTGANARRSEGRENPVFVFSAPNSIGPMISNTRAISNKRFSFALPQLLNVSLSSGSGTTKAASSFQQLKAVNANKWTCDVCKVLNEQHLVKCFACKSSKSTSKSATPSKIVAAATPPSFQQLKAVNANKWTCDVCMVPNEQDVVKCVACESKKPAPKTAAPPSFQQLKAVNANKWTCDVCMVPNEQDVVQCVACESKKPAPKTVAPSDSAVKVNFGYVPLPAPAGTNSNQSDRDIRPTARNAGGAVRTARPAQSAVSRSNGPAQRQQPAPVAKRARAAVNATAAAATKRAESVITISDDSEDDTDSVCEITEISSGTIAAETLPAKKGSPPVGLFASVVPPSSFGTSTNGSGGTPFTFGSGGAALFTFGTQPPSQVPSAPPKAVSGGNLFSTPHFTATQPQDARGLSQNNINRAKRPLGTSESIGSSSSNGNHSATNQAGAAPKPFSFSASTVPNFNFSAPAPMESTAARAQSHARGNRQYWTNRSWRQAIEAACNPPVVTCHPPSRRFPRSTAADERRWPTFDGFDSEGNRYGRQDIHKKRWSNEGENKKLIHTRPTEANKTKSSSSATH